MREYIYESPQYFTLTKRVPTDCTVVSFLRKGLYTDYIDAIWFTSSVVNGVTKIRLVIDVSLDDRAIFQVPMLTTNTQDLARLSLYIDPFAVDRALTLNKLAPFNQREA